MGNYNSKELGSLRQAIDNKFFGEIVPMESFCNDILYDIGTREADKLAIDFENGQVTVLCGDNYAKRLKKVLKNKKDYKIAELVRNHKVKKSGANSKLTRFNLQPNKGTYDKLRWEFIAEYFKFCEPLVREVMDNSNLPVEKEKEEAKPFAPIGHYRGDWYEIEGHPQLIQEVLIGLEEWALFNWKNTNSAVAQNPDTYEVFGTIATTTERDWLCIHGEELIAMTQTLEDCMSEYLFEQSEEEE